MPHRSVPRLRSAAAFLVLAVYAIPPGVGVLSGVGHGLSHLVAEAQQQRRAAATLGLGHGAPAAVSAGLPETVTRGVVHTHGGVTHAHSGSVETLLRAAGTTDGHMTAAPVAPAGPTLHVATRLAFHLSGAETADELRCMATPAAGCQAGAPDLPPPRAQNV